MRTKLFSQPLFPVLMGLILSAIPAGNSSAQTQAQPPVNIARAQVPEWSGRDMNFFLHGTMSTEVVPEAVLLAFMAAYPDLFPSGDLSNLGLIPDLDFGWPIGFSKRKVAHLGGLQSLGVNCASCHVGEVKSSANAAPIRVLGMTSLFDAETYFGAVTVATFRTADPANMKKFMPFYLTATDQFADQRTQAALAREWQKQEPQIIAAMKADPTGSKGLPAGALHELTAAQVRIDHQSFEKEVDLAALAHSMLKLFHNMRASLHIPNQPPQQLPPPSGPGRNDAFGLLSAALFHDPQPFAPVKYGLVWNVDKRQWVHWDSNTQSPLARNLLSSLGLGAPLIGKHAELQFSQVKRQTDLSEKIHAPRYPFEIDDALAGRGAAHYQAKCAGCHEGPEGDARLYSVKDMGTQPLRAELFTQLQADRFNKFMAELETPGYRPPDKPGFRSTQKYWAASLAGVWARSPYLHNGSVRTMEELLSPTAARARTFRRGTRVYDMEKMGYTDDGSFVLDTSVTANSNSGHEYGTDLTAAQKRELIEYLKTL